MTKKFDMMIVGTDTGIGKSVVSLLAMQLFYRRGFRPIYVKPFQTGCRDAYDSQSDAAFVYRHTPALRQRDPVESVICCYPNAKAPFFAARDAGRCIDMEAVVRQLDRRRSASRPLVVEAAGGLMVPVTEDLLVVDVIERFKCSPLLVARAGLGTINHTLLSVEVMRQRGVAPAGVVLIAEQRPMEDTQLVAENITAIETYGRVKVGGVVPRIEDFDFPPDTAYAPLQPILFPVGSAAGGNF